MQKKAGPLFYVFLFVFRFFSHVSIFMDFIKFD